MPRRAISGSGNKVIGIQLVQPNGGGAPVIEEGCEGHLGDPVQIHLTDDEFYIDGVVMSGFSINDRQLAPIPDGPNPAPPGFDGLLSSQRSRRVGRSG